MDEELEDGQSGDEELEDGQSGDEEIVCRIWHTTTAHILHVVPGL